MEPAPDVDGLTQWTTRLRGLSADDWARVATNLAAQRGDSITALWRRARYRRLWVAPMWPVLQPLAQVAMAAGEMVREFSPTPPQLMTVPTLRGMSDRTGKRVYALMADALEITQGALPGDTIAEEAALVAGTSIANRARMNATAFAEAYAPFAGIVSLDAPV